VWCVEREFQLMRIDYDSITAARNSMQLRWPYKIICSQFVPAFQGTPSVPHFFPCFLPLEFLLLHHSLTLAPHPVCMYLNYKPHNVGKPALCGPAWCAGRQFDVVDVYTLHIFLLSASSSPFFLSLYFPFDRNPRQEESCIKTPGR